MQAKQQTIRSALTGYDAHKERTANRSRTMSASGRDIGDLPDVVNPVRKQRAAKDFRFFCEQYFPQTFVLAWSDDHLKVIARIEQAVLEGGLFALAMPRGSGKTTLSEIACLWAIMYGHREFIVPIGSDEGAAEEMLDSIKIEMESNERLLEDFPEVVFPIHALEGIHQRSAGQLYRGQQTHIGWTVREIVLPTIEGSLVSGAIIRVAGITGRIRGMKHKRVDGTSIRPSLVLIDDPQTDESARSPSQCATRERILAGAILGLAGPGKKIAGLMPLTVIRSEDMADRILDREKHPQWQGERTKMVYTWPTNEAIWTEYAELRRHTQESGASTVEVDRVCNQFYLNKRVKMDEGTHIAWPARHEEGEVSAIQHAWNLRIDRGDVAFFAEYQNEPLPDDADDTDALTVDLVTTKLNSHKRGEIPANSTHLTMYIDVQGKALFYVVVAWEENFTGYVVDYGTEPDQKQAHFSLRDIRRTLLRVTKNSGLEAAIYAGLERLTEAKIGKEWKTANGSVLRIGQCLIDASWGDSTDVVYQFCRQSKHASVLLPSHGRGVTASSIPFAEYKRKRGDRVGLNWRIPVMTGRRAVRHVVYDTNFWKSFLHSRVMVAMGDPGCLSLFGKQRETHRLLAEHCTSEFRVKTEGRGRTVFEWKCPPNADNHWWDCVVGCAVAGEMLGARLPGVMQSKPVKRKRLSLAKLQRERGGLRR